MSEHLTTFRALLDDITQIRQAKGVNVQGGKKYTQVQDRVEALRRHFGDHYGFETNVVCERFEKGDPVIAKCIIRDESSRIVATGHAVEFWGNSNVNRTSAIENAETSAIGRALAALGVHGGEFASSNEMEGALVRKPEAIEASPSRLPPKRTREEITAQKEKKEGTHAEFEKELLTLKTEEDFDAFEDKWAAILQGDGAHQWTMQEKFSNRRLDILGDKREAEQPTQLQQDTYKDLVKWLAASKDPAELKKRATADAYKAGVKDLTEAQRVDLRAFYSDCMNQLQAKMLEAV